MATPFRYLLPLLALALPLLASAQDGSSRLSIPDLSDGPVYEVPIEGMIDKALARYVERAVNDAEAGDAALIVFHVDTFGGLIDAADEIRTTILDARVPTVAYIDKNAASAGALISYAADKIAIAPGGSIGAATAVDATGTYASEKVQSYMRSLMRATAEANGRDPRIAEAMVDETLSVPGVVEEGQLLSLSAEEALRLDVADAIVPTLDDLFAELDVTDNTQVAHRASGAERVLRFLGSPVIASILMLMMMGGLYFELQTPGVGFAGAMAFLGAAMFFAPHYMLGLVESWEIALFVIGLILLAVEVFVVPGFGVPGIAGILCIVGALFTALVGNVGLDFPSGVELSRAAMTLASTFVLLIVAGFSLGRYLPRSERFNRLILAPELSAAEGYTSADSDDTLLGRTGTALTTLRPAGTASIDDKRVDVVAEGTFIDAGTAIEVISVRGSRVEVRAVPETSTV